MSAPDKYEDAHGTARAIVTALLHHDTDTSARLAASYPDPFALAVAATSLAAMVHTGWARATGIDPDTTRESWTALMADLAVEDAEVKP